MIFLRVVRFVRGEVAFSVSGGQAERFLNLCAAQGIPLWCGRREPGGYRGRTSLSASRFLPALAEKAGVTLRISGRLGIPCILLRYRRRGALLAGAAVLLAALLVMSGFIWKIEVDGCEEIDAGEVLAALEELGVHKGVWRGSIDSRNLERRLLTRFDQAAWVGVNLRGSTARIEFQERTPPPERIDDDRPHNVTAARTGYIQRLEVYNGQAVVVPGDTVCEGDILISGITEDKNGAARLLHARGRVIAQYVHTLSVTEPYVKTDCFFTGEVLRRRYLKLGDFELPLFIGRTLPELRKTERASAPLPLLGALLPVGLTTEYILPLRTETTGRTPDEAREAALAALEKLREKELSGVEILSAETVGQELEDGFLLECSYLCLGDIGVETEILTE